MSAKINSGARERAVVLVRGISVMMCRYAVVRREQLLSITRLSRIRRQAVTGPARRL